LNEFQGKSDTNPVYTVVVLLVFPTPLCVCRSVNLHFTSKLPSQSIIGPDIKFTKQASGRC